MDLDFLSNFVFENEKNTEVETKKGLLKFLKQIGVDTRFISFYQKNNILDDSAIDDDVKLYIENLRFSKFSKKRTNLFHKYYPNIDVLRSSLFQKICSRASKTLANSLNPQSTVLIPKIDNKDNDKYDNKYNELLYIVLEPYSRKYAINFIEFNENISVDDFDSVISPLNLNQEVSHILNDIFNGNGIEWDKKFNLSKFYNFDNLDINGKDIVFPFINVPEEWINDFLGVKTEYEVDYNNIIIAESFMGFLAEINPQFKENILLASSFLETHQKD